MGRHFNVWSLIFLACCTSVTWEALTSTMAQSLRAGGSSSLVWGFVAAAIGALSIALSLSEFASMVPTAGGQYHYVAALSPLKYRRLFSWIAGWATIWSWVLSTLTGIFSNSMQLQAYIILFAPDYVYQRWHTSMIVIGMTTCFLGINILGTRWLHRLTFLGIVLHIAGYVAIIVYLLATVHPKNTAAYVFSDLTNLSGWKSDGVSWSIGLMSSAIAFINWDSATHMAEEMQNASRDLPRVLYGCVALSGIITFPWVIALAFCMTDIEGVLNGPVGRIYPLVQLIYNVSGGSQSMTIGLTWFYLFLGFFVGGPGCMAASSRVIWSFAREGGLPDCFSRVHSRFEVPVNALLLSWVSISALALIYIGNETAFYGLASGVTVVMIFSYAMPIFLRLIYGFKHSNLQPGPFTLGAWGLPINIFAACWCTYLIIFMCLPTLMPVTKENMNYAVLIFGASLLVAAGTWWVYGRRVYLGVLAEGDSPFHEETVVDQQIGHEKKGSVASSDI
ncbi:Amino acid/polyamine transporter I [Penicillium concentricum]|uniref:Amino acid/polyamine transporter I n=1 Tax=Penicillium concentricum TaxID=293559 RepID=A0A9W9SAF1_9EURO|nr:Amino acid/polyamine transporter I [Penicillium concentricum]KAJ5373919.1 Amino acid/polyamine transporter I [Penicillium concentricum]